MKKIISSILVCVMLAVLLVPCGFASEQTANGDRVVIYSENIKTNAGEDFAVDVNVRDNPGIMTIMVMIEYDSAVLDVTSTVENERLVSEDSILSGIWVSNEKYRENAVIALCVGIENVFADGKLFGYRFSVKEDAPAGKTSLKVKLNEIIHFDDNGGTYDTFDLFEDTKPSYDVTVAIGEDVEIAPVSELELECMTETEFAATYEERIAALQTPKPTPRPIYATPKPGNSGGLSDGTLKTPEVVLNDDVSGYMKPISESVFEPDRSATRYEIVEALDSIFTVKNAEDKDEFSDVAEEYKKAVNDFAQVGIINGYEDKTFGGDRSITRAEFVKLLTTAFEIDYAAAKNDSLTDIAGHWAEEYISAFVNAGYILGYPDGTFKPDSNITRAEAVTVLNRVLKIDNVETEVSRFDDLPEHHWAYPVIMAIFK